MADVADEQGKAFALERIAVLSDAVFAFALTLLVIEIQVPIIPQPRAAAELPQRLLALWPKWFSYLIAFTVIALYWSAHHRVFTFLRRYDNGLIALNFALLLTIAVQPFATGVVGEYGNTPLAAALYAALLSLTGFILYGMWLYATAGHRLVSDRIERQVVRHHSARALTVALIFLVSVGIAVLQPGLAQAFWVVGGIAAFLVTNRIYARRRRVTAKRR